MSNQTISGLGLKDRNFNSFFQDNKAVTDDNLTGSPALGRIVGGLVLPGANTYSNGDGCPFTFNTAGELKVDTVQSIDCTNLNAVGSTAGSNYGAWVNVSDYHNKTIYQDFTSGAAGSPCNVFIQVSPDAGSTVFDAGSIVNDGKATSTQYTTVDEHHNYIRTKIDAQAGNTITVKISGRGGD